MRYLALAFVFIVLGIAFGALIALLFQQDMARSRQRDDNDIARWKRERQR